MVLTVAVFESVPAAVGVTTTVTVTLASSYNPQAAVNRRKPGAGAGTLAWGDRNKVHARRQDIRHGDFPRAHGLEVSYRYGVGEILPHLDRVGRIGLGQRKIWFNKR